MKMLEDLGTSPAPWTATADSDGEIMVNDENGHGVAACGHTAEGDVDFANARLIAAAPELYECLRESLTELCKRCVSNGDYCAPEDDYCPVRRWRKVLEKAGGAE